MKRLGIIGFVCLLIYCAFLTFQINELKSKITTTNAPSEITVVNKTVTGFSTDLTKVVSAVKDSVVNVSSIDEHYNEIVGSGTVVSSKLGQVIVVSDYQLVKGSQKSFVTFANGSAVEATIVGFDKLSNLVVLEVNVDFEVESLVYGDSSLLSLGEWVISMGSVARQDFINEVSVGIISSTDRIYSFEDEGVRYDMHIFNASIQMNEKNTGGPVVNMQGEMMGVVSSLGTMDEKLIIPVEEVEEIVRMIMEDQEVRRIDLGIVTRNVADLTTYQKSNLSLRLDLTYGLYVNEVLKGSITESLPIYAKDVILRVDQQEIGDFNQLRKGLQSKESGDLIELILLRDNEEISVSWVLE